MALSSLKDQGRVAQGARVVSSCFYVTLRATLPLHSVAQLNSTGQGHTT